MKYVNPIIPGYNPDPSICRVGDDFYLVNSTFEFFPGVPIYHSKNLVNWELIGHCLTREEQLYLTGCRNSGGIYAPTIRYHDGTFFMITTNVTHKGNFVVHTKDIRGQWSKPYWIDQGGIDPSLFWDDDGTCYYCSTGTIDGVRGTVTFEINPFTGEILSEKKIISSGCGGQCPEGPHIYKKDGYYYHLLAEGGTEYGHRVTIQRSKNIWGPYEDCPHNPIFTHKEYKGSEIHATGHADIIQDQHGEWWMVFLGIRRFSHALLHNLGRETFLAPVKWEEGGWPVCGNNGTIEYVTDAPLPAPVEPVCHDLTFGFSQPMPQRVFYTRNPDYANYALDNAAKKLTLKGTDVRITEPGASPTILNMRQQGFFTTVTAKMSLKETDAERAGIAAYYNNDYHYAIYLGNDEGGRYIGFTKQVHDINVQAYKQYLAGQVDVELKIESDRHKYTFSYRQGESEWMAAGSGLNAGLSTEGTYTMTFTGTLYSMFAENGSGVFLDSFDIKVHEDPVVAAKLSK